VYREGEEPNVLTIGLKNKKYGKSLDAIRGTSLNPVVKRGNLNTGRGQGIMPLKEMGRLSSKGERKCINGLMTS